MRFLYAVFDRKAQSYGPVMSYPHDAVATRDFGTACADSNSMLSKYPEDFELRCIGTLDDGDFCPVTSCEPHVVVTAAAVKAMNESGPELVREA